MADGRRRPARAAPRGRRGSGPGRKRGGGLGLKWLWLGALMLIGVGVLFAREAELSRGGAAAMPTPDAPRATSTVRPAAAQATAPVPVPVLASPTVAPTRPAAARATATPAPAAAAAARATSAPTPAASARTATPIASGPTVPATPRATAAATTPTVAATTPTVAATTVSAVATRPPVTSSGAAGSLALTFDAGSDRGYAQDILDTLAEERVVASFGITGVWAKANSDLVRRMAADGHLVFNHTLDHRSFTGVSDKLGGLSPSRRRQELDDADAIIAPLVGYSLKPYYRLPYGDDDARVAADVLPAGYSRKVGWTVDSLGWRGASAADIVARCLKLAAPGGVYVFHVGRASQDSLALPQLIHGLRERGYGFIKVDQTV